MDDIEKLKLELIKHIKAANSEAVIEGIDILIDLKLAECMEQLSLRLEKEILSTKS